MATYQSKVNSCLFSVWLIEQLQNAASGALAFIRWGVGLFIFGMLLDWQTFMPVPGRVVIFAVVVCVTLIMSWRHGWGKLRLFNARNMALHIEELLGRKDSLLVTAVQLGNSGGDNGMIELTCQRAEDEIRKVSPVGVVSFERLMRPAVYLGILIVSVAMLTGFGMWFMGTKASARFLGVGIVRIFPPWVSEKYPTRTTIKLTTEELIVKEGDPTAIRAQISGVIPANAEIQVRPAVGKPFERSVSIEDERFEYEINSAYLSFEYRIFAGDDRTEWQKVTVVAAPRVERAEVTLNYPAYTQRPTETVDALTLTVPEGTEVKWVLHLDRPVTEASMIGPVGPATELTISEDGMVATLATVVVEREVEIIEKVEPETEKTDPEPEKIDPQPEKDDPKSKKGKKAKKGSRARKAEEARKAKEVEEARKAEEARRAEEARKAVRVIKKTVRENVPYKATKSQAYSFSWVEKTKGYSFKSPNNYLQVQPDEEPQVEITKPEKNIFATLGRELKFAYRARDDHRIDKARIGYRVNKVEEKFVKITAPTPDQQGEMPVTTLQTTPDVPSKVWDYRETLKTLVVGDSVTFVIEMSDSYPGKGGPHVVRSQARRLSILSKNDYLNRMYRQRVRLLTQVKNIYREERGIHRLVKDFEPTSDNFIQTCQMEVVRQELIRERLLEIKKQMAALVEDLAANGFTEKLYTAELTGLQSELQRIADDHIKLVSKELKALAIASTSSPETAEITGAVDAVNFAARELGIMVLQLGFKEATEVMAREILTVAEDQAYLRWRVTDAAAAQDKAQADVKSRQNELAEWLVRLLGSIPADRESTQDDALVAFKLSRLRKDLVRASTAPTMRKAAESIGTTQPEATADLQAEVVKALLKAEFRLRRGLEYAALVRAGNLFKDQAEAQKELREAVAEMSGDEFKKRKADVEKVQRVLSKRLALLMLPAMPAPRYKLLDAVRPPKPRVAEYLAESVRAQKSITQAIDASDRNQTIAAMTKAEATFNALEAMTYERLGQLSEAQRVGATAAAAGSQISKIATFAEQLSSILEKTGDAQEYKTDVAFVIPLLDRLALDLNTFKNGVIKQNKRISNSPESIVPIVAYLENSAAILRRSATAVQKKKLDEAIALQEKVEQTFEEMTVLLTKQSADVGSFSSAISINRVVNEPGPLMRDIQSEQYDMVKTAKATKDDDLPGLAMAQKNLIHAVNAVLSYLDPFSHHIETGSVMLFAKEDMDAAAIGLKEKDREEALDAGSFVAESLQKLIDQISELAPQYTYSMELVEFNHVGLSERITLQALQKQLAETCTATSDKGALAKLVERQEKLVARSKKATNLLVDVTGLTMLTRGTENMEGALMLLKAGDASGAAEQMTLAVNALEASNTELLRLNVLIPLVLAPPLAPAIPPEFSFLVDFTSLATSHKVLYRATNVATAKDAAQLATAQTEISKKCELFLKRYTTLSQQVAAKQIAGLKASYARMRNPTVPLAQATAAKQKELNAFFSRSGARLTTANGLMQKAAAKLSGGSTKEAIAIQRQAADEIRKFYVTNILAFIQEPGPPPDNPPAPSYDISTEDDMLLVPPGSVVGKKIKGGRLEWQVLGRRDRAALNENFARELPLEYRGILKDYYERLAK